MRSVVFSAIQFCGGSPLQEFRGEMSCKTEVSVSPNGILSARAKVPLPPEYQETPDEPGPLELQPRFSEILALEELLGGLQGREDNTCWDAADLPPPFLQEIFQNSPSPFCLLKTLSAGDMAGTQVPPCGSEQTAQRQGKTGVSQTQQYRAGISFPLATAFSTAPHAGLWARTSDWEAGALMERKKDLAPHSQEDPGSFHFLRLRPP